MNLFKSKHIYIFSILLNTLVLISCDDTTDTIGTSLLAGTDIVNTSAEEFNIISRSVPAGNVVSRTAGGYIGKIKDNETGDYITCSYMTQFRIMDSHQFPSADTVYIEESKYDPLKSRGSQVEADSCSLVLYIAGATGDSLALMKVTANEMQEPYEESETYTTDFNPEIEGMIREESGSMHSQMSYTISNRNYSDTQRNSSSYVNKINISLNAPYTDREGNTYNNYGTYLMRKYFDPAHAKSYQNSYTFAHDICPGFYIKNTGGIGSIAYIDRAQIIVNFRGVINGDSVVKFSSSFAGTEEVMQRSYIKKDNSKYEELTNDAEATYLKTPAGLFTELTLPVEEIMSTHTGDTINAAHLFIPRINNDSSNDYSFSIPQTLLLIPTDSVETFFKNKQIANYRTTYLTNYSSQTNGYTFGNISLLISKLNSIKEQRKGEALSENWNKVMLIPVSATYTTVSSSTSILTKVTHDMSFTSTKLKKGTDGTDNIKLSVIYSKFNK